MDLQTLYCQLEVFRMRACDWPLRLLFPL